MVLLGFRWGLGFRGLGFRFRWFSSNGCNVLDFAFWISAFWGFKSGVIHSSISGHMVLELCSFRISRCRGLAMGPGSKAKPASFKASSLKEKVAQISGNPKYSSHTSCQSFVRTPCEYFPKQGPPKIHQGKILVMETCFAGAFTGGRGVDLSNIPYGAA